MPLKRRYGCQVVVASEKATERRIMAEKLMFVVDENETTRDGVRALAGTPALVECSAKVVNEMLEIINDEADNYGELFEASKSDHVAMETLINSVYDLNTVDVDFLKKLDEETLNGMLKSQQSKRSRAKSKTMTMTNYKAMMNAAVSELLLRIVLDKPRGAGGFASGKSLLDYTPEEIQALGEDQEALRRAIRNVQSQKCIMKHRDDFEETSEAFQSLLKIEAVLKDLRVVTPRQRTDKTKKMIQEALAAHDVEHLKAADSKELLKMIAQIVADEEPTSVDTDEPVAEEADNKEVTEDVE